MTHEICYSNKVKGSEMWSAMLLGNKVAKVNLDLKKGSRKLVLNEIADL